MSKSGNPRLRMTLVQMAWLWVRHQPRSALTLGFKKRVKQTNGRLTKTMIVGLARSCSSRCRNTSTPALSSRGNYDGRFRRYIHRSGSDHGYRKPTHPKMRSLKALTLLI